MLQLLANYVVVEAMLQRNARSDNKSLIVQCDYSS
jgi:hypothetical protein